LAAASGRLDGRLGRWLRRFDKRWLAFVPAVLIAALALLYAKTAVTLPSPARVMAGAQGIDILDRNGNLIYSFGDQPGSGKVVPLGEVSPHLIEATVATEDAGFWDNPGVNFKGLLRAAYENVAFWEKGGFFKGSGGSSITQQLAKNLYIDPEDRADRSPLRKLNETIIAFELTRRYSKEQILEWYLANLYYGNGAYGIESASQRYFSKPPSELTLAEAALLAGIPRSPLFYDPLSNFEAARERQRQVLGLMVRHGFISKEEMEAAASEALAINEGRLPEGQAADESLAPHFAFYVRDLLPVLLGQDEVEGHLTVTTTLDSRLQRQADDIVKSQLDRLEAQTGVTNGALVAIDPRTGEILAMVGSHDFFRDDISGQVNNALAVNQSGSAIKPVTYLTAFLKGWNPDTRVVDERITLGDDRRPLGNADGRYRGEVTVRVALGSSLNVPAVKALQYAGLENVMALARRMGITTLRDISQYGPAFTLGADVNLLDLTYVYAVLANGGQQAGIPSVMDLPEGSRPLDPVAVLKVENGKGDVVWQAKERTERVVPEDKAYQITDILSDDSARVSMFGANSPLNLPGRPAAVKSGSSDETRDAWTLGYTPQLVAGVWVGNANNAPIPNGTSTYTAAPIWRAFMLAALQGQPVVQFPRPRESEEAAKRAEEQRRKQEEELRKQQEEEEKKRQEEERKRRDERQGATPTPTARPVFPTPTPPRTPASSPTRPPVIVPTSTPRPQPTSTPATPTTTPGGGN